MRRAVVVTRRAALPEVPTPHPNPSPGGEGLNSQASRQPANGHGKTLLRRDKGTLEAKQKGRDEGQQSLMKARARSLRRKSTDAEILLWQQLRNRRLSSHKFRRQVPIGNDISNNLGAVLEHLFSLLQETKATVET